MHRYMDQVVRLTTQSVTVREVLLLAFNMLVPPTALFQPRVLLRVLAQVFKPVVQGALPQNTDFKRGSTVGAALRGRPSPE